nr:MAG TPA: hypothetical protein [Caudoviricetes sp.]
MAIYRIHPMPSKLFTQLPRSISIILSLFVPVVSNLTSQPPFACSRKRA